MPPKAEAKAPTTVQGKGKLDPKQPRAQERGYYVLPSRVAAPLALPVQNDRTAKLVLGTKFGLVCHGPTTVFVFRGSKSLPVPFFEGKAVLHVACGGLCALVACSESLYLLSSGGQAADDRCLDSRGSYASENSVYTDHSLTSDLCVDPLTVAADMRVTQVAVGRSHALALCVPNHGHHAVVSLATRVVRAPRVYVFGSSGSGALGLGQHTLRVGEMTDVPFFVPFRVISLHAGPGHSVVVCLEGVYAFGDNATGQLGLGHGRKVFTPELISSVDAQSLEHVECGATTTVFLLRDGTLKICGDTMDGSSSHALTPKVLPTPGPIRSLSIGSSHMLLLGTRGDVYTMGIGGFGELGLGPVTACPTPTLLPFFSSFQVLQVACGAYRSAVLCVEGLYLMGRGADRTPTRSLDPATYVPSRPSTVPTYYSGMSGMPLGGPIPSSHRGPPRSPDGSDRADSAFLENM